MTSEDARAAPTPRFATYVITRGVLGWGVFMALVWGGFMAITTPDFDVLDRMPMAFAVFMALNGAGAALHWWWLSRRRARR